MRPVSDEQIQQAKNVDVLTYLLTHEPHSLQKSKVNSNEYYLVEHDSLKISNGKFNWFSRGVGGYSMLDFLIKVRGMGFIEAVHHLTDRNSTTSKAERPLLPKPETKQLPKKLILPPANVNNDRVYAYLRGRGIDGDIIKRCFDSGILYESSHGSCIFVGYDDNKPRFACERGIRDKRKQDISGSDKRFSFVLPPKTQDSSNLAVYESAIDILSHVSIHKLYGNKWDGYRLSLSGVGSVAVMSFLERNPQIENVLMCLDCDTAGKEATSRIIRGLLSDKRFSHLKITVAHPSYGNDYSDTLQAILQLNKQKTRSCRSKEAVHFI